MDDSACIVQEFSDMLNDIIYSLDDCFPMDILQGIVIDGDCIHVGEYKISRSRKLVLGDGTPRFFYDIVSPLGGKIYRDISNITIAINIAISHRLHDKDSVVKWLELDTRHASALQEVHFYMERISATPQNTPRYDIYYAKYTNATHKFDTIINEIGDIC